MKPRSSHRAAVARRLARCVLVGALLSAYASSGAQGISTVYPEGLALEGLPAWGVVESPNQGNLDNSLKGIAALATNDIWAVGEYNPGIPPTQTGRRTLTEHWDGAAWRIVTSPNPTWPGMDYATLEGVHGVSANDVWAVGYSSDFATLRSNTLIEHWDGTSWTIVRSPNPAGTNNPNTLHDVEAVSPTDAWAVGEYGTNRRPLILRWNGTRWREVGNSCGAGLYGITVIAPDDIWAVGASTTCHYDGTSWTRIPTPPSGGADTLLDVEANAPDDVWAVGHSVSCFPKFCSSSAYAIHWDGAQWKLSSAAGPSLSGVVALAPDDVWAVGTYNIGTLIQHWDGSNWSTVPSPNPGNGGAVNAIDALAAGDLWAVGFFLNNAYDEQTLVLNAPSNAQGNIVGDTNVAFALASWFGPGSGTTETDAFGAYEAAGLLAGTYTFTASATSARRIRRRSR